MRRAARVPATQRFALAAGYTPTLAALLAFLETLSCSRAPLLVDLTLGAWRGHQAARECCSQLGLPLSWEGTAAPTQVPRGVAYADLAGIAIDAETAGDRQIVTALRAAESVAAAMAQQGHATIVVLAPRRGMSWAKEDVRFLEFIAPWLRDRGGGVALAVTAAGRAGLPAGWRLRWPANLGSPLRPRGRAQADATASLDAGGLLLPATLVPGTLAPDLARRLGGPEAFAARVLEPLLGGCALVAPEYRLAPEVVPLSRYAELAALAEDARWLAGFANCFTPADRTDLACLIEEAGRRQLEGGLAVALRLLDRAAECSTQPDQRAGLQCRAQGMRIAAMRFEELAAAPVPPAEVHAAMRGFLCEAKGWGLVMLGRAGEAEPLLAEARNLLGAAEGSRDRLYLLNVSALNRFRAGDANTALTLEREIEAGAAALPESDARLQYVNFLNLARLYRADGENEQARQYFALAFGTAADAWTEGDAVYANATFARLDAAEERWEESFFGWLRASLHWLSSATPEALPTRAQAALVGWPWPLAVLPRLDETAASLAQQLRSTAAAAGLHRVVEALDRAGGRSTMRAPQVMRSSALEADVQAAPYDSLSGVPGVALLVAGRWLSREVQRREFGRGHKQLRRLAFAALGALVPEKNLLGAETLVVDDARTGELPRDLPEAVCSALRHAVPLVEFGGERWQLDPERRARLELAQHLRFSHLAGRLERRDGGLLVRFKRYFSDLVPTPSQATVLDELVDGVTVAELVRQLHSRLDTHAVVQTIRELQDARVLVGYLEAEAIAAAGLVRPE